VADHVDAAKGPVDVTLGKWTVTKATFDPANLEGGTAEIEVDLTALSSGIPDRDAHLQSPDFLDTAKFAKATAKVDNVKKSGEKTYTADVALNLHGVEKKMSTTFEVVASTADSVTVKVKQGLSRVDFGMTAVQDKVKPELVIDAQLTFKKM
jgi:polyisoprenoid-binding protein YceI